MDTDTTLIYSDYEPYGEGQLNSTEDIPKRGYMGNHISKENGYYQMGARLYNSETGRFMSVDPMLEYFTEQSPYNYAFNNPVMFNDPSGLAPEGEKNNRTMGLGGDAISGFIERGYWTEVTSSVVSGTITLGLDDPLGPARRIDIFGTETTMMWVGPSGGGGGGSNSSSYSVTGWNTIKGTGGSTRKLFNPNRRRSGSFVQQDAVSVAVKRNVSDSFIADNTNLISPIKAKTTYTNFLGNSDANNWTENVVQIGKMFYGWITGSVEDKVFFNDNIANAMRNANKVNKARNYFYHKYKDVENFKGASVTKYDADFGFSGLLNAGVDPVEQFIGSYKIDIYAIENGNSLMFILTNTTSFTSFFYGFGPEWEYGFMGNFRQIYIFTEPVRKK